MPERPKIFIQRGLAVHPVIWVVLFGLVTASLLGTWFVAALGSEVDRGDQTFDVILLSYDKNPSEEQSGELLLEIKVVCPEADRVITYPSSYVPILVHNRHVSNLQKQLGAEMLVISPSISVNPRRFR